MEKEMLLRRIKDILDCNINAICSKKFMHINPYGDVDETIEIKVDGLNFIYAPHIAPEDYTKYGVCNELRICVSINGDEAFNSELSDDDEYMSFYSDDSMEKLKKTFDELTEEEKTFKVRFRRSVEYVK